jgi:hypothetical protein
MVVSPTGTPGSHILVWSASADARQRFKLHPEVLWVRADRQHSFTAPQAARKGFQMNQSVRQPLTSTPPDRRSAQPRAETVECPRCGRFMAKIIGRSEVVPVVYLRCDGCHLTSVAGA